MGHPCCREPFPLLADPVGYAPDTLDIWARPAEMEYWLGVLGDQVQTVVEKAVASEANSQGARRTPGAARVHAAPSSLCQDVSEGGASFQAC